MPTTKTISHIGNTKFELVKDTYDAFRFTVDDKASELNSPKTVMYISSEPTDSTAPTSLSTSGRVTMSNIRTEGATSTSSADVDGDIGVGGKILIREGTGTGTATRAAIYAEKDTTISGNHRLILDPYPVDGSSAPGVDGTVYIKGNLIVEGDKTILDTAEHITSENFLGINAIKDSNGNTTGGAETTAGIHVYSSAADTQFLYNFGTSRWRTAAVGAGSLNDLEAKHVYVTGLTDTGTSTLATVDINGGNIDGTAIGGTAPNTAKFTTLEASGTSTLTTVNVNGGNINGTAIGTVSASGAKFTTLDASGAATLSSNATVGGTLGVTGATTMTTLTTSSDASVGGTLGVTGAATLSSNATVGGTLGVTGATTMTTLTTSSDASVGGTLGVTGAATLSSNATVGGTLGVTGATTMTTLTTSSDASVGGTLGVTGAATLSSNATVGGTLGVTGATTMTTLTTSSDASVGGTLGVTGAATLSSNATVGGTLGVTGATTMTTLTTSSNATVGGTLGVTGATTMTTLTTSSDASVGGTLGVIGALTAASGNFGSGNVTAGTFTGDLTGNVTGQVTDIANHTTTDLSEGSNKYYTDARARSAISLAAGETFLVYDPVLGKLSTDITAGTLGGLGDVTLSSVSGSDILTYDSTTSKWVNSNSLTIKSTANADVGTATASVVTEGGLFIKSQQALDLTGTSQETALVCLGGAYFAKNIYGDSITVGAGVNAKTIGNIVPVELSSSGGRSSIQTVESTTADVPLHADILNYYSGKSFAAGQCVVALTDGTDPSVAMFSFSKCGSTLTMVLDQEVHSSTAALYLDYDSSGGTINLNLGSASEAKYCVKVLPVMTSDSIDGSF